MLGTAAGADLTGADLTGDAVVVGVGAAVGATWLAVLVLAAGWRPLAVWPVTGAVVPVTGASGCAAAGEAVSCPDAPVAGAGPAATRPVPTGPAPEFDWVVAGAELVPAVVELVPAVVDPECAAGALSAFDAVLTADPATELTVETAESGAGPGDGGGSVAACACLENTSMIRKIPAATIASCTARRAMRAIGCGMVFSHLPDT